MNSFFKKYYFLFLVFNPTLAFSNDDIAWYAFGDLRGYIEPCGCDPITDLGGIRRISNQLKIIKSKHKILLFDLGNNLEPNNPNSLKSKYISRGIDLLSPDASLFNIIELNKKSLLGKRQYVLSNRKHRISGVSRVITNEVSVIYGFVETIKPNDLILKLDEKLLSRWKRELWKTKKKKILLFSGSDISLKKILDKKIFDDVISSNKQQFSTIIDNTENLKPGLLLRVENPAVYMVPVGGQGLLKSLNFPSDVKIDLTFSNKLGQPDKILLGVGETSLPSFGTIVDWLPKELDDGSPLEEFMKSYEKELSIDYDKKSKLKLSQLKNSDYTGAAQCKVCHVKEWEVWNKSSHATALNILKIKNKHKDEHCVVCHVLGFDDGGYVSAEKTPQFIGVQCESCHGASKEHVKNPLLRPGKTEKTVCVKCHISPHSPNYNLKKYWNKIKH